MGNPWTAETQNKEWFKESDWLKRHEGFLQRARSGKIDVLFLGDSITEGWFGGGAKIWQSEWTPLNAANFGIGGDEVQHVLWRVLNGEIEGVSPKVIVIMVGTNNLGNAGHNGPDTARGIELLVSTLRAKLPAAKILLFGVFPRDRMPETKFRREIAEINRRIGALAGGAVTFVDITKDFLEPSGEILPTIMPDFLHLTEAGYEIWARELRKQFKTLLA